MSDEEELKKAKRTALQMLTFRARSKQEIRDKLTQKGISASIIETVLAHLTDYGYLDDQAFGQKLALSLFETKGWGFARIGVTLRDRGLSPELVKKTISQLKENYSEEKTALRIMKRRFPILTSMKPHQKTSSGLSSFFGEGDSPGKQFLEC